jgi:hypothetical protein
MPCFLSICSLGKLDVPFNNFFLAGKLYFNCSDHALLMAASFHFLPCSVRIEVGHCLGSFFCVLTQVLLINHAVLVND